MLMTILGSFRWIHAWTIEKPTSIGIGCPVVFEDAPVGASSFALCTDQSV